MSRFLSEKYKNLKPYVPGEQPQDMAYLKLNTNESPFPPSPLVLERLAGREEADRLRLYPDPEGKRLRDKLASRYGVKRENVFVSNGSDEALAFAFMAFFDEKTPAAFPDITYGFYPVYCDLFGIPADIRPLRADFSVNATDYVGIGKNIVLANPNAPTGLMLPLSDIEEIVRSNPQNIVLVDEAYIDFGGESAVGLIDKYDNLLIVGTFSKSRSLAGGRLGFVLASPGLIEDVDKMRYSFNSYNVSRLTLTAGEAALDDDAYYMNNCREIAAVRDKTADALRALGFTVTDSKANFLFARHPGFAGETLYKKLRERGILVRHFDKKRISDYLRITVGTSAQMDTLLSAVGAIISEGRTP
jgi:histidinol-phosphate aminotransferase